MEIRATNNIVQSLPVQFVNDCPQFHLAILAAHIFWQIVEQTLLLKDCLHILQHLFEFGRKYL